MAHIRPIVIRTISDLAANNMYISIHCEACERWNDIDPEAWIDGGLPDVDYVQAVFKCEDCGAKVRSKYALTMQNAKAYLCLIRGYENF